MENKKTTTSESEPVWLERVASIPVANVIILSAYGVYRILEYLGKEASGYLKKK